MYKATLLLLASLYLCTTLIAQSTTVYTCKGGTVAADIRTEFSNAQIQAANNQTINDYGYLGITLIDNSSNLYNCHAYAWHLREGNANKVWINNALPSSGCYPETHNIDKYWTDGCFIQVCNEASADKVHYYCGDHSAVASTSNPGMFESKWGQLAVVRHTRTGVPYMDPTNSVRFYASTKISGATTNLCTGTRTFAVKNISGATYSWTYSSGLSVVGSTTSNQLTVQRNGSANGAAWVQVQINTSCSSTAVTSRADFTVGGPSLANYYIGIFSQYCIGSTDWDVTFEVKPWSGTANPDIIDYTWSINGATVSNWGSTYYAYVFPPECLMLNVKARNACGLGDWLATGGSYVQYCSPCAGAFMYTVSPNPSGGSIAIAPAPQRTANSKTTAKGRAGEIPGIVEVNIYRNGTLIRKQKLSGTEKQVAMNVAALPTGLYLLEIVCKGYKESHQLMIASGN